jgi:hypothetical protein
MAVAPDGFALQPGRHRIAIARLDVAGLLNFSANGSQKVAHLLGIACIKNI